MQEDPASPHEVPNEYGDVVGESFTMSAADLIKYQQATVKLLRGLTPSIPTRQAIGVGVKRYILQAADATESPPLTRARPGCGTPRGRVLLLSRFHDPEGERCTLRLPVQAYANVQAGCVYGQVSWSLRSDLPLSLPVVPIDHRTDLPPQCDRRHE